MTSSQAAEKRTSVRTYGETGIPQEKRRIMEKVIQTMNEGILGTKLEFHLINPGMDSGKKQRFGTYGFIQGAKDFIIGHISRGNLEGLIDFGYGLEKIVLQASKVGLGTCIVGGTFKPKDFEKAIKLDKRQWIPAISPIGIAGSKKALRHGIINKVFKPRSRKPMEDLFFDNGFDTPLEIPEDLSIPFKMVQLGPSADNAQPWRIVREGTQYHFFLSRKKAYKPILHLADWKMIDMGIAIAHFEEGLLEIGKSYNLSRNRPDHITLPEFSEYIATFNLK